MEECHQKTSSTNSSNNSMSKRMYKALRILIFGVMFLCVLEFSLLIRSPQCYFQEGHYSKQDGDGNIFGGKTTYQRRSKGSKDNQTNTLAEKIALASFNPSVHIDDPTDTIKTTIPQYAPKEATTAIRANTETTTAATLKNSQYSRQRHLRDYCRARKTLSSSGPKLYKTHNMLYSDKVGLVYCYVPKVACTNWKRMLQVFNGKYKDPMAVGSKEKVHKLTYPTFQKLNNSDEIEWRKNSYYSFMFVRHPFERILSAYRNKLRDPYNKNYQRIYGSQILRLFRKGLAKEEYRAGRNVTFEEFVDYIIFVYNSVGPKGLNEHWQIMHNLCKPCLMRYNFIGKMDTLLDDAGIVFQQIGWHDKMKFPANATDKYQTKTKRLMTEFYSQLSKDRIDRLYEIYKPDFLAFDYPMNEY